MSPNPRFQVPLSGAVSELVRRLHEEAVQDGRGAEFVSAFRTIRWPSAWSWWAATP